MKYAIVILDGAADHKLGQLNNQTALEAATTPILDLMAQQGTVGLARTVPEGMEVSSNAACTSILGYDPVANFAGRGAIEAAAQGIKLAADEVAMRINTVSILDGHMESYAGGNIKTADSHAIVTRLGEHLNDDTFTFYPGKAYRHILVVKGYPAVLDLDYTPPHDLSDMPIGIDELPRGGQGEDPRRLLELMAAAHEILKDDPTNARLIAEGELPITDIWPFWPGSAPRDVQSFKDARGLSASMTSSVDLLRGLAVLFDINFMEVDGVTDGLDNDFGAQAEAATLAFESGDADLVVIHVEAPDEMGHQGDIVKKIHAIEMIDREIMTRLFAYAKQRAAAAGEENASDFRILAMPDHFTPIVSRTHEGDPVPFLIWGGGIDSNGAAAYSEEAAAATGLALDPDGYEVLNLLLKSK
ncbi:MAG: 2,3-bisphosphoglycerate-independent phosphoglycerate mutase [Coriobacteriia bacterium]|nr:2,3-bisphosphoglycerate-independent phosphoglycerate mutase [Coriobacteriia bacterium]